MKKIIVKNICLTINNLIKRLEYKKKLYKTRSEEMYNLFSIQLELAYKFKNCKFEKYKNKIFEKMVMIIQKNYNKRVMNIGVSKTATER